MSVHLDSIASMGILKDARQAARAAPDLAESVAESAATVNAGVKRASQVISVIGVVALAALICSVVAVYRARN